MLVGKLDGCEVGEILVGSTVGMLVGIAVGIEVGPVGISEGMGDGTAVEGRTDGFVVG